MERFVFKIDKAKLICGLDYPDKVPIVGEANEAINAAPDRRQKIRVCEVCCLSQHVC